VRANVKIALVALDAITGLLHKARVAVHAEPRAWEPMPLGAERTQEYLTVLWTQQVIRTTTQHLALLSKFCADAARLASDCDASRLEMLVRTGPSHWGDNADLIAAADAAWERGEGVRLGDKR
jgi:hypothetical protein